MKLSWPTKLKAVKELCASPDPNLCKTIEKPGTGYSAKAKDIYILAIDFPLRCLAPETDGKLQGRIVSPSTRSPPGRE
jgi:hypothetical protein